MANKQIPALPPLDEAPADDDRLAIRDTSSGSDKSLRLDRLDDRVNERGFAQSVDSVSTLRTSTFPASLERLWLSGYYGVGTAGGGPLYRDSADTTSSDNGGTVFVDADGVRWKRPETKTVNITQFGAKGDGVADDTAYIQNAVNAFESVTVPRGHYIISSTIVLQEGSSISGVGQESTLATSMNLPFLYTTESNVSVRSLRFEGDGEGNTNQTPFNAEGTESIFLKKIVVSNLFAEEIGGAAIVLEYCEASRVDGLTLRNVHSGSSVRRSREVCVSNIVAYGNRNKTAAFSFSDDCVADNVVSIAGSSPCGEVGYTNGCNRVKFSNLVGVGASTSAFKFSRNSRHCSVVNAHLTSSFVCLYFQGSSDCNAVNITGNAIGDGRGVRFNSHGVTETPAARNLLANSAFFGTGSVDTANISSDQFDVAGPSEENRINNCRFRATGNANALSMSQARDNSFSDCFFENQDSSSCIDVQSTASENLFKSCDVIALGTGNGVIVRSENNKYLGCSVSAQERAFRLLNDASGTEIIGCSVSSATDEGVSRSSENTPVVIAFNYFANGIGTSSTNVTGHASNV